MRKGEDAAFKAVKIAAEPKLQLCGWGGQAGYALEGCVEPGLLRPPPQPHSSQLGTVYATKRRRRNGKRSVLARIRAGMVTGKRCAMIFSALSIY